MLHFIKGAEAVSRKSELAALEENGTVQQAVSSIERNKQTSIILANCPH